MIIVEQKGIGTGNVLIVSLKKDLHRLQKRWRRKMSEDMWYLVIIVIVIISGIFYLKGGGFI